MSHFKKLQHEDQRLVILRFLGDADDYKLNASLLQDALATMGHNISRDLVLGHVSWLEEQGLVTQEKGLYDVVIVTITDRGLDVGRGSAKHEGVKRPRPSQV